MKRNHALDGIRGLALIAVLGYHAGPGLVRGGFLGVEMFFVLSGYLLTALLLRERARTGGIDHGAYAARRVRRLAPAGLAVLAALLLAVPVLARDDAHRLGGDLLASLAGLTNWHLIAGGASYFADAGRPPFVRHLWSLGVEIQFCAVCSLAVAWLARRSRRMAVGALAGGIAASAVAMGLLFRAGDPSRAYYGTDARASALLTGMLLAVVLSDGVPRRVAERARAFVVPGTLALGVLVLGAGQTSRLLYPLGFLATQAATSVLIVVGLGDGRASGVLATPVLRWLGERSYGIYLWHWPLVVLLRPGVDVSWHPGTAAVVSIGVATALGALSFRFVERPVIAGRPLAELWERARRELRWHERWATAAALATILAVAGTLVVRLPTLDPIAASISEGERFLAAQADLDPATPSATESAGARVSVARPVSAGAPTPAPRPAPGIQLRDFRPGSITVTAIGDSVMVGGARALSGRLGSSGYIDAAKNRRFSEAAVIARGLREDGRLGRVVIVHLGNNGPVTDGEIEDFLHQVRGVHRVLLVTVRVNRGWQDSVNDTLRAGQARHRSTIDIVDWHKHSDRHPDWFHSDGTHLRSAGAEEYARLLAGSIPPPPAPTPKPTPRRTPSPTPAPIPLPTLLPPE